MAITINGTTGIASVDASVSAPSIRGTDSNTGISYGADSIKFSTGGVERMAISNSGVTGAGGGKINQIVQDYDPVATVLNSGSAIAADTDYTILSRTITPTASDSKVLIMANFYLEFSDTNYDGLYGKLMRDSTQICLGDAAGSRNRASFVFPNSNVGNRQVETTLNYLDSPSTTSEITYTIRIRDTSGAGPTVYFNRTGSDADNSGQYRTASTLICMEVGA